MGAALPPSRQRVSGTGPAAHAGAGKTFKAEPADGENPWDSERDVQQRPAREAETRLAVAVGFGLVEARKKDLHLQRFLSRQKKEELSQ